MFICRSHKSNGAMKMTMIIAWKEAQTIGLSPLKAPKSTRIGRMLLQGRKKKDSINGLSVGVLGRVKQRGDQGQETVNIMQGIKFLLSANPSVH